MNVIKDVYFYYGKLVRPGLKFGSQTEREYSIDVLISKEDAATFANTFAKQKPKKLDRDEFVEKFKVDPPYDSALYHVIKLKKPAQKRDGSPLPEIYTPKAYVNVDGRLQVMDKEFHNGAKGAVEIETFQNDYGSFARLKNIRLDSFEEYVREDATATALGEVETADVPFATEEEY